MKPLFPLAALALALASCSTAPKNTSYSIKAVFPDSTYNGKTAYIAKMSDISKVDSAIISNNEVVIDGVTEQPLLANFMVDKVLITPFILENSELTVDFNRPAVTGGEFNLALIAYNDSVQGVFTQLEPQLKALDAIQDREERSKVSQSIVNEQLLPRLTALTIDLYKKNLNNVLGVYAIQTLDSEHLVKRPELEALLAEAGPVVLENDYIVNLKQLIKSEQATEVGKMFTDFTVKDANGKEQKLSDYVGKGKYVLVDFWASWCGPCMAEVPTLKEVYEKYKGDKFEVLGVAVWDKQADSEKAIEKESLPWPQILNTDKVATTAYAIKSIPQIMLFGPDGTILKKGLRGAAIEEEIKMVLEN